MTCYKDNDVYLSQWELCIHAFSFDWQELHWLFLLHHETVERLISKLFNTSKILTMSALHISSSKFSTSDAHNGYEELNFWYNMPDNKSLLIIWDQDGDFQPVFMLNASKKDILSRFLVAHVDEGSKQYKANCITCRWVEQTMRHSLEKKKFRKGGFWVEGHTQYMPNAMSHVLVL